MLTIICGPMFSGKTTWLLNCVTKLPHNSFRLYKPDIDTRYSKDKIVSHNGISYSAVNLDIKKPKFADMENIRTIIIDELNFFSPEILIPLIRNQLKLKRDIIAAGLNYDYQRKPFGATIPLTEFADNVIELFSICDQCGMKARHVYRKIKNKNRVLIGSGDAYGTCCELCWADLSKS